MTMDETRDLLRKISDSDGLTDEMKEDIRKALDSADESIGMRDYWERIDNRVAALHEEFRDFQRKYVDHAISRETAAESHRKDARRDGRDEWHREEEDPVERIYTEEVIEK